MSFSLALLKPDGARIFFYHVHRSFLWFLRVMTYKHMHRYVLLQVACDESTYYMRNMRALLSGPYFQPPNCRMLLWLCTMPCLPAQLYKGSGKSTSTRAVLALYFSMPCMAVHYALPAKANCLLSCSKGQARARALAQC